MHPPVLVQQFIAHKAEELGFHSLQRAVSTLSESYRENRTTAQLNLTAEERVAAYLLVRLPATYAAAHNVLGRLPFGVESLLDLGAGTGAATLAARELFPLLEQCTLMEADLAFLAAGKELLPEDAWQNADFRKVSFEPHDVVIASYCLGELPPADRAAAVDKAWAAASRALILIEPGSPAGFAVIREARQSLLARGARMVAPCPTEAECPVPDGDWCHFAQRLERSSLHRRLKQGALSYEDEKFSYVIVVKGDATRAAGRIIRRPVHRAGLIELTVCSGDAIGVERVTRRNADHFRNARKASWGDEWRK